MDKVYKRINWENKPSRNTAVNEDNLNRMDYAVDAIDTRVCELAGYEERAAESESAAKASETKAAVSEGKARTSETNAKNSETKAKESAGSSDKSAVLSQSYAVGGTGTRTGENTDNAKYYKEQSQVSQNQAAVSAAGAASAAEKASISEKNAKVSENNAKTSETHAKTSETNAQSSAVKASASSDTAGAKAKAAESYAVGGTGTRTGENTDNAKYYKEQTQRIAEGLKGSLIPMGTILFTALPDTSTAGYMYNISNEFTTTSRFKEGAGNVVPAGTNVYYTADGYWDCMAGSPVTGIKGSSESSYRRGNVNLTKADIGLGNVLNVNTNDQAPTFTQATAREAFKSGEKLSQILGKVSKWFADLKTGAFSTVVNNDTTTAAGYVADARIVKVHGDEIDALKKSVSDGKKTVAAAITAQGVNTAADAEFSVMATNVNTVGTNKYNAGITATRKGTATAGQVLTGYTFTNSSGVGLSGSMPNRGALVWNPDGATSYNVPAGYYSGGKLNSSAAYNKGVADADNRPNGNSVNYVSGYNAGVAAADNRANPGSVNYQTGYNNGYGAGKGAATPYLSQHQHFQNQVYNSTVSVSGAITTSGTGLVCVLITLSTGASELTVYDAYGASCSYAGAGLNCNAMYQHSFSITYRYNFAVTGGQTVSAYGIINAGAGSGGYRDGCRVANIEILEMRTQ